MMMLMVHILIINILAFWICGPPNVVLGVMRPFNCTRGTWALNPLPNFWWGQSWKLCIAYEKFLSGCLSILNDAHILEPWLPPIGSYRLLSSVYLCRWMVTCLLFTTWETLTIRLENSRKRWTMETTTWCDSLGMAPIPLSRWTSFRCFPNTRQVRR